MRANPILTTVALVGVAAALIYGLVLAYTPTPQPLQGQIEAREYNVSSKVAGRVEQMMVRRGDLVHAGDLLFSIDSPELNAKLLQASGALQSAKALQAEADNGARKQQIAAAREQWRKAQAAAKLAKTTYARVENLFNDGVVARQKRDEAYTQWQAAKYTEQSAKAMYDMAQEGARSEQKVAAEGNAKRAEGAVQEVNAVLADSQMRAPKAGEITEVLLQPGELAGSGFPVVTLIDMQDSWAIFQVREDLLKQFHKGDIKQLQIPALGKSFDFKVSYISAMGDFATWRATESGHDFDMRTFQIELRPTAPIADLRAGMSVLLAGAE